MIGLRQAVDEYFLDLGNETRRTVILFTTVYLIFQLLGLASSVHAVLNTRTAQGAIAWVVSLNTLPMLSVPIYWVLGRSKFEGYVNKLKIRSLYMEARQQEASQAFEAFMVHGPEDFPEYSAICELSLSPFLKGNQVELLVDGEATFASLLDGIDRARDYVLFQFYILRDDESGNRFMQRLASRARQGVQVHVLYDGIGSFELSDAWLARYRRAGIQFTAFNTVRGPHNRFQINFRNHRKIMVVDGREAWLGGLNIGDEYLHRHPRLTPWRDTHLRIEGPAALVAQSIFWADWYSARKELLRHLHWLPRPAAGGADQDVLVLGSGPADELETASLFFTTVLNAARRRIWIATPYFIPDEATLVSLRLALLRKVEVHILTPRLNDNWFVRHAANVYLSELHRMGAKVSFYRRGFMHQKVVLVDDKLSLIGTVNFDNRSFRLNFEVTGAVADRAFAQEVEKMLKKDFAQADLVEGFDLRRQPFWEQLKARACVLLAPVL